MGKLSFASTRMSLKIAHSRKQDVQFAQEDHRARFFEDYRKEAEEYDREFMKKHDEDLNTTLIFVSSLRCPALYTLTRSQAGLFSAVTSAFIIDVQSQLQPDTGEETVALLRVLIHKIDNTTFSDDPPVIPQWTGPPHTIVHVQAILYASLVTSLFSAFLAMLGRQWLNRYASTELRGTTIERSQNRQRKLDGIVAWYFDHVMESLPLMLQVALLLFGCALSRYLWEVNITVASVVLGVTSAGLALYILIVAAGVASESCPYQTPGSNTVRYLSPKVQRIFYSTTSAITSTFRGAFIESKTTRTIQLNVRYYHSWWSRGKIAPFLKDVILETPRALVIDVYHLGRAMVRQSVVLMVSLGRRVHNWPRGKSPTLEQKLDQQTTVLELRCVSWMLRTSLDKAVHLSILKHLATMVTLASFDPTLVMDCFNAFLSCVKVDAKNHEVVIVQGPEQLATTSAMCVLNTISHLLVADPTSTVLEDVRQRYVEVLSPRVDFHGHRFYHTMNAVRCLFVQRHERATFSWSDCKPSAEEHVIVARNLVKITRFEYQRVQRVKVPRWILRFASHSLSLDPPPPTPVVADCLSIIAIELGCDVSYAGTVTPDERCVQISEMTAVLTLYQRPSGIGSEPDCSEARNNS